MTYSPANTLAPFIKTSEYFPEEFEQFRIKFLEIYRNLANTVNLRDNGVHDLQEFLTGQQWFTSGDPQRKRDVFRKVFEFTNAPLTFNHNITGIVLCTYIGGSFTDGTNFYPLPFISTVAITDQVAVQVTPTQIVITRGGTAPAITNGVVVLEYLKN